LPLELKKQRSTPEIFHKPPMLLKNEPNSHFAMDTTVIGSAEVATDEDQASPQRDQHPVASNKIRQNAVE